MLSSPPAHTLSLSHTPRCLMAALLRHRSIQNTYSLSYTHSFIHTLSHTHTLAHTGRLRCLMAADSTRRPPHHTHSLSLSLFPSLTSLSLSLSYSLSRTILAKSNPLEFNPSQLSPNHRMSLANLNYVIPC